MDDTATEYDFEGNYSAIFDNKTGNEDYIFDKTYIRVIFITLYSIVFCLCFFGNLLVILVLFGRRLRSTTNFFLANLAVADICVGLFCVYQNLLIYIVENWMIGEFLCKMYVFIQSVSNSASIVILVLISAERYFAILHPMTCKQIFTSVRLKVITAMVWTACIFYSAPKFYWGNAVTVSSVSTPKHSETVCVLNRQKYNSQLFDIIHFVLLYLIPLTIISLLYARIAICLWRSSEQLKLQFNASTNHNYYEKVYSTNSRQQRPENTVADGGDTLRYLSNGSAYHNANLAQKLKARRGVVKMLIIVVGVFALCNLPFHARKMWQYWSPSYQGHTNFSALLTPLTFLATYFNSGVNPLLYAFLSKNFRKGMKDFFIRMKDLLFCYHNSHDMRRSTQRRNQMGFRVSTTRTSAADRENYKQNQSPRRIVANQSL